MNGHPIARRWDEEYRRGRYADEPPLPFVQTILNTLVDHHDIWTGRGLYVGCGNGRNYLPLLVAGAKLLGLDISEEAVKQLADRQRPHTSTLVVGDFRRFRSDQKFSYLIAIQVFQHGTEADVDTYFEKVTELLRPGGLFFLRVNSAATEVYHRHTVIEQNGLGGFTVRYEDGPKQGLAVHFSSRHELIERTAAAFEPVMSLKHDVIERTSPQTGVWAQWEGIWRRRDTEIS
jgi:SAM-dependent methyltransferase